MLTRRHFRIKVMQSVYSFIQNEENDLQNEVIFFKKSFENTFSLYLTILAFFKSILEHAEQQNSLKGELRATKLKEHPGILASNAVLKFIANHSTLATFLKRRKIKNWDLDFDYVKSNYKQLIQSDAFKTYSEVENPSLQQDRDLILFLFKEIIAPSDKFYDYIEDKELTWIDDLPVVNTFLSKMLNQIDPNDTSSLPFPQSTFEEEDPKFGIELLEKVISKEEELQKELEGRTPNWENDRIATLDAILIKMAIAELIYFPSIPTKVTMNEYIEISKDYSTPKSNVFINGILDKVIKDLEASNRIKKSGRGLI